MKNQEEMSCSLKEARNKLVTKDFDLNFGYRNGFLADSETLCMCPCSFNFIFLNSKLSSEKIKELKNSSIFIPLTFDIDIFPNTSIWEISHKTIFSWGVQRLFTKYQLHKLNVNGKKAVSSKDSLCMFC